MKLEKGMIFKVHIDKFIVHIRIQWAKYCIGDYLYMTLWENSSKHQGFRIRGSNYGNTTWNQHAPHNWEWVYKNSEPLTKLEKAMYGV